MRIILLIGTYVLLIGTAAEAASFRPGAGYWCLLSQPGKPGQCFGSDRAPVRLRPDHGTEKPERMSYYALLEYSQRIPYARLIAREEVLSG